MEDREEIGRTQFHLFSGNRIINDFLGVVASGSHQLRIIGILPRVKKAASLLQSILPDSGLPGVGAEEQTVVLPQ